MLNERIKEHIRKAGQSETGYVGENGKGVWWRSSSYDWRKWLVLPLLLLLLLLLLLRKARLIV